MTWPWELGDAARAHSGREGSRYRPEEGTVRALVKMVAVALLLTACGETYGPAGPTRLLTGGGYRDRQIDNQSWEVEYSGANYDFVYNAAVHRSAEIAKSQGYPYFTVVKVGDQLVPNYTAGSRYVGSTVFIKLRMQGWRAYEDRCASDKVVGTPLRCDLFDTERTLASWRR